MDIQLKGKLEDPILTELEKSGVLIGEEILLDTITLTEDVVSLSEDFSSNYPNGLKKLFVVIDPVPTGDQSIQVWFSVKSLNGITDLNFVDNGIPASSTGNRNCLGYEIINGKVIKFRYSNSLRYYPLQYYSQPASTADNNLGSPIISCRVYRNASTPDRLLTTGSKFYFYGVPVK